MAERVADRPPAPPGGSSGAAARVSVVGYEDGGPVHRSDLLAVEEPLEIRVVAETAGRRVRHPVAVTMRTPGHDFELATGFLFSEGAIHARRELWRLDYCEPASPEERGNVVEAYLAPGVAFDAAALSRNVYTSSSCGVCGKTSIEQVLAQLPARRPAAGPPLERRWLLRLPAALGDAQPVFARTGGLHAAALFEPPVEGWVDAAGAARPVVLREDVGRHNALDKLVGSLFLDERLPAAGRLLLVSGRASFELVQKAALAGLPALAAVGAPSSLAVELAGRLGMTLIGFLRDGRFNVYAGGQRVTG